MNSSATPEARPVITLLTTVGKWLHRRRRWGLLPLLLVGLFLNTHFVTVRRGNFMTVAGAFGILFGSLLRVVCYKFVGGRDPIYNVGAPLITDGPYAITRNPVYLSEAAIALGIAMMSRMPWFVLATLAATIIMAALVVEWEERVLHERYGSRYEDYCRIVPRWFSLRRFVHRDSYTKTRGRVHLLDAIRAESITLLIGLLAILAFLTKADLEWLFWPFNP
jgi:protein-S-isoprenylcysteine O-methyltransferase Ste14